MSRGGSARPGRQVDGVHSTCVAARCPVAKQVVLVTRAQREAELPRLGSDLLDQLLVPQASGGLRPGAAGVVRRDRQVQFPAHGLDPEVVAEVVDDRVGLVRGWSSSLAKNTDAALRVSLTRVLGVPLAELGDMRDRGRLRSSPRGRLAHATRRSTSVVQASDLCSPVCHDDQAWLQGLHEIQFSSDCSAYQQIARNIGGESFVEANADERLEVFFHASDQAARHTARMFGQRAAGYAVSS
ncbi:hypothetical protein SAMN02787118_105292 [Streptomyces mirabilis]|uniref:Uncharacterized protein n=1 Tax=Streptomyces mirabilis TaxID=68239 RepID=A0A1I2HRF9_9ACTN|nr:hypothetical protein SAMN02787118_105292 [Streptomyces mirabilis]